MKKKMAPVLLLASIILVIASGGMGATEKEGVKGMCGLVFFKTLKLQELKNFYIDQVGCTPWLDQGGCMIFRHGNFLFGLCQREEAETCGIITFFYQEKKQVDRMYEKFKKIALSAPKDNPKYHIYHFFARDPENRLIEFQYFNDPIDWDFQ